MIYFLRKLPGFWRLYRDYGGPAAIRFMLETYERLVEHMSTAEVMKIRGGGDDAGTEG
jgi:hypothetical protein